jgi:hypothetical protein
MVLKVSRHYVALLMMFQDETECCGPVSPGDCNVEVESPMGLDEAM